jgi:hypothetical protein
LAHYRFYHMSGHRIVRAEVHECADDAAAEARGAAILAATAPQDCDAVDVWQGDRRIAGLRRPSP